MALAFLVVGLGLWGSMPALGAGQPKLTRVQPHRIGDRVSCRLQTQGLPGQKQLETMNSGLESAVVKPIRDAIANASGIPPRQVIITCTHTHSGPSLIRTNYHIPVDEVFIRQLSKKLVHVADAAITAARPAKIGWGKGRAQIGFNRRFDANFKKVTSC